MSDQAKLLADRGFNVTVIDVGTSNSVRQTLAAPVARAASVLGSACILYKVKPAPPPHEM